jgi:hypothetical protein
MALSGTKGGHHLAGGRVDHGVPVHDDGWDGLIAVSHRPDEGGGVGICPDVDLVNREAMPPQDQAEPQAEHAPRSPIQRDVRTGDGWFGGAIHGNQSTMVCSWLTAVCSTVLDGH